MNKLPNYKIGSIFTYLKYMCRVLCTSCTLHIFPCLGYCLSVMRTPAHKHAETLVMITLHASDSAAYVSKSMGSEVVDLH